MHPQNSSDTGRFQDKIKYPDTALGTVENLTDFGEPITNNGFLLRDGWRIALEDLLKFDEHIIKHLIYAGELSLFVGGSGTYKSFLVITLMAMLSIGQPVFGRRTKQVPVLIALAEGIGSQPKRLAALVKAAPWADQLDQGVFDWFGACPALSSKEDLNRVKSTLEEFRQKHGQYPKIMTLDTLSRMKGSYEENSNSDMAELLAKLQTEIAAPYNLHIMLVHHTGKPAEGREQTSPRGASALRGNVETVLLVTRNKDRNGGRIKLEKVKDGRDGQIFEFTTQVVELGEDQDGDMITSIFAEIGSEVVESGSSKAAAKPPKAGTAADKAIKTLRRLIVDGGLSRLPANETGDLADGELYFNLDEIKSALIADGILKLSDGTGSTLHPSSRSLLRDIKLRLIALDYIHSFQHGWALNRVKLASG